MLILASASPRRQELLRNAGFSFAVHPANVHEEPQPGEPAEQYVQRLAQEKAEAVGTELKRERDSFVVLGADTTVLVEGAMLEKPRDREDAKRMLRLLSGKNHQVITGVCLLVRQLPTQPWRSFVAVETTEVTFGELAEDEIESYVRTGEPLDKAGAYAIQGIASRWIPRIQGCYFNVVGLPVSLVNRMLKEHAPHLLNIKNS